MGINFPAYKRLMEYYSGDDDFRKEFDSAPEETLARYGLNPGAGVDFLTALTEGMKREDFSEAVRNYPKQLAELKSFITLLERGNEFLLRSRGECGTDMGFESWRKRRRAGNRAVLQPRYFDQQLTIAVAFELGVGCSGHCPFCCLSAGELKENFRGTTGNREYWRKVLELLKRRIGERCGAAALYWGTDPFDNPDFEKFAFDFYEITGVLPPMTTRWALRDPARTRRYADLGRRLEQENVRISVTTKKELRAMFAEFSPEESLHWSFVLNNPESLNRYSVAGRVRGNRDMIAAKGQFETTSCCLYGYLINMCQGSVKLISPCLPDARNPGGFHIWASGRFRNAAELEKWMDDVAQRYFRLEFNGDSIVKLSPQWSWRREGENIVFESHFLQRAICGKLISKEMMADLEQGIAYSDYTGKYGGALACIASVPLLHRLRENGMLEE